MSTPLQRFLAIEQGIVPALFNFFINGGIAWWLNRQVEVMPFWGAKSIIVDTLATAMLLPLITCLIVSPLVAGRVRRGRGPVLAGQRWRTARIPGRSSLGRGMVAGLIGVGIALPVLVLWHLFGAASLPIEAFLWFKAGFAAVLGGGITALIAWWALVDASRRAV